LIQKEEGKKKPSKIKKDDRFISKKGENKRLERKKIYLAKKASRS